MSKEDSFSVAAQVPLPMSRRDKQIVDRVHRLSETDSVDLFFLSRPFASLSLPHRRQWDESKIGVDGNKVESLIHTVSNGRDTLVVEGSPSFGLPCGTYPRLFHYWVCTEIQRTRSGEILLGASFTDFMRELGFKAESGTQKARFLEQIEKFLNATYRLEKYDHESGQVNVIKPASPVSEYNLDAWRSRGRGRKKAEDSVTRIIFQPWFVEEILNSSIPFSRDAIIGLRGSSISMDLYTWITWRSFTLARSQKRFARIALEDFAVQMGVTFTRLRDFKSDLEEAYREVQVFYPEAKFSIQDGYVHLHASVPAIAPSPPSK